MRQILIDKILYGILSDSPEFSGDCYNWDKSDCSETGVLLILLDKLLQSQSDGYYGERSDSIERVELLLSKYKQN